MEKRIDTDIMDTFNFLSPILFSSLWQVEALRIKVADMGEVGANFRDSKNVICST
jgi:hypothetical protein